MHSQFHLAMSCGDSTRMDLTSQFSSSETPQRATDLVTSQISTSPVPLASLLDSHQKSFPAHGTSLKTDVAKLVQNQISIDIVKLKNVQKILQPSEADGDGLVVNCLEAPLDVGIKGGGCVVVLNNKNLSTVELVGLRADLVRLNGWFMCSPGFSCD